MLMPVLLLAALISGVAIAQLMSNRIEQSIEIKGLDGQVTLEAIASLPSSESFDQITTLNIVVEKLRPVSGFFYLQINNSDLSGISPGDVTLELSHRVEDGSAHDSHAEQTMTIIDGNCIQFKEALWFYTGQMISGYNFFITWLSSAVSGNYSVSVFVEST